MAECIVVQADGGRRNRSGSDGTPSIYLYVDPSWESELWHEPILYGIEEEEVPAHLFFVAGEGYSLGLRAAKDAATSVGIAIGSDGKVVLHHQKLAENRPVQAFDLREISMSGQQDDILKMIGTNAARLVKGVPLVEIFSITVR
jgi:hypothetical protein